MPPLFSMRLTINEQLLERMRSVPRRAQATLRSRMQTELRPILEARANELFGADPGPVSDPYIFGNSPDAAQRSHDAYMAIVREIQGYNDPNGHWIRTGIIERGFRVYISDRLRTNLIRVVNIQPKGRYVYGPWLVEGHDNTGWPRIITEARTKFHDETIERIRALWGDAVRDATAGRGSG